MLRLKYNPGEFELYWNERVFVSHSRAKPFLTLGKGKGLFRMRHGSFKISQSLLEKVPVGDFEVEKNSTDEIIVVFNTVKVIFKLDSGRFIIQLQTADPSFNRCWIRLKAFPREPVYGCGEQYSVLNLRGRKLPVWCEEQGIGRGRDLITLLAELTHGAGGTWYTTYFPIPVFLSGTGWYCHVDSYAYTEFDFRQSNYHEISVWGVPDRLVIGQAEDTAGILADLTELLGRQPALPDWAMDGVWLGIQGGRDTVRKKLDTALSAGVKVAAVWAQDWQGIRKTRYGKQLMWDWQYDKKLYPDLPGFIRELNDQGIRFLGYINPFLAVDGKLYREASKKGYLVRNSAGNEYQINVTSFMVAMLDFTNPQAFLWIKDVIKNNMMGIGLSGWMADFAEYLPVDSSLYSGEPATTYHNKYPVMWAKANREAVEEAGMADEVTFFHRSGYTGTARYAPLIWAGDQLVNWSMDDGLASVIPAGISLGLSGIGQYHSDMGGFTTGGWIRRSKELFMRWTEHAAFTLIMRSHEGNMPDINWHFDSDRETLEHLAGMSRVYAHLKPYREAMLEQYRQSGIPAMRHLMFHYGDDPVIHELQYQYMFGRDLLVAPVYKKGRQSQKVYLPEDQWTHLWTGQPYGKGWHKVDAPLGQPPVFYRNASEWRELFQGK